MEPRPRMAQPFRFDAATALCQGTRSAQEDAVLCDMPRGTNAGLVVLADGLGGHAAGAVASRLAVSTAHSYLAAQREAAGGLSEALPALLRDAAHAANTAIHAHTNEHPETRGMGATLVMIVLLPDRAHWLSIGDSPLFLMRDGETVQINQTHSLASQLDLLAKVGEITPETAQSHPDRDCLTSALGAGALTQIDCPEDPLLLRPGDALLAASDGILTLPTPHIHTLLEDGRQASATDTANRVLTEIAGRAHPKQDNLSLALIRVSAATGAAIRARATLPDSLRAALKPTFRTAPRASRPTDKARPSP